MCVPRGICCTFVQYAPQRLKVYWEYCVNIFGNISVFWTDFCAPAYLPVRYPNQTDKVTSNMSIIYSLVRVKNSILHSNVVAATALDKLPDYDVFIFYIILAPLWANPTRQRAKDQVSFYFAIYAHTIVNNCCADTYRWGGQMSCKKTRFKSSSTLLTCVYRVLTWRKRSKPLFVFYI